jgi:hypothetical protein
MACRLGGRLVDIDRVAVANGPHPVVDHRLVHRIPADARLAAAGRLELFDGRLKIHHRGTLGTFRPDAAQSGHHVRRWSERGDAGDDRSSACS